MTNRILLRGGQVITMDPGRFWEGVYEWFRSRGVDYDTPGQ